jgi:parallel beta-helix repeat protein
MTHLASYFRTIVLAATTIASAKAEVLTVTTTIQAAIDAARPGDTVHVPAGIYKENVHVNKNGITLAGVSGSILDGTGSTGDTGITVAPIASDTPLRGFSMRGIHVRNYSQNGVLLQNVVGFQISNGTFTDNDKYGIFPIFSSKGTIELNTVSGSNDTGIYVGQSTGILVRLNVSRNCAIGFEVENSSSITVEGNLATGNSTGILVDVLPGLDVTSTSHVNIASNFVVGNNRPNLVTDPADILSLAPSGAGILNVGGDHIVISNNQVFNNKTVGIGVVQFPAAAAQTDPRIDPVPDRNQVRNNIALQNGSSPDPKSAPAPGSDLGWDGSGAGNCWARNLFRVSVPPQLPSCER